MHGRNVVRAGHAARAGFVLAQIAARKRGVQYAMHLSNIEPIFRERIQPMKLLATATALCLGLASATALANEPTEKDAIAMAERGAALIKSKGKDEMMKRITAKDPDFCQGELYVDLRDIKTGIVLAHPYNPSIVGKDLTDVPDANGKKYRREIIELAAAKGKGWVDYQYKNPKSGKIEPKTTYILRVDDVVLEAGLYKK
jgi:cytochrome c